MEEVLDLEPYAANRTTNALSREEQQKVDRLFKIGNLHLRVGRLILPEGSSAYAAYQTVLEIDPGNAEARAGMTSVQENVLEQLHELIDQGRIQSARDELALARRLFPDNRELRAMESQIGGRG
jgi:hypothetical protein